MDDNLKTFTFPADAVQRGSPKVPSKEPAVGVGGGGGAGCVETASSLILKENGPSSSLKCTSELEWTAGLSLALLQLISNLGAFLQNGGNQPAGQLTGWLQQPVLFSSGPTTISSEVDTSVLTTEQGPDSDQPS